MPAQVRGAVGVRQGRGAHLAGTFEGAPVVGIIATEQNARGACPGDERFELPRVAVVSALMGFRLPHRPVKCIPEDGSWFQLRRIAMDGKRPHLSSVWAIQTRSATFVMSPVKSALPKVSYMQIVCRRPHLRKGRTRHSPSVSSRWG